MGQGEHPIRRGSGGNLGERMNAPDMDFVRAPLQGLRAGTRLVSMSQAVGLG